MSALPLPPTLPGGLLFGSGPEAVRDPLGLYTRAQRALGDVVRLRGAPGIHWFLVTHPAGVEQVLKTRQKNYRKPARFTRPVAELAGLGLLAAEGDSWLRQRRLMQPAFHRQRLAGLVEQMAAAAGAAAERWEGLARRGELVDITAEMLRVTLRIVGTTLFSADLSADADRVGTASRVALEEVSHRMTMPFAAPLWVPTARNRRFRAARAVIDAAVRETIRERRSAGGERGDLLSMLLAAQDADTGEGMSDEQVRDEVFTLMLAGHETAAASLSWAWHLLGHHPAATTRRPPPGCAPSWTPCWAAGSPPPRTCPGCRTRAPSSRRRCGSTRPPGGSRARRWRRTRSAGSACPRGRCCWSAST